MIQLLREHKKRQNRDKISEISDIDARLCLLRHANEFSKFRERSEAPKVEAVDLDRKILARARSTFASFALRRNDRDDGGRNPRINTGAFYNGNSGDFPRDTGRPLRFLVLYKEIMTDRM